jgi:hypothetical protein
MTANKVKTNHFVGAAKVYSSESDSLTNVIRGLVQDLARSRIDNGSALTDNTAGVAVYPYALGVQAGSTMATHTDSGTDSAPKAGFDTAVGQIANGMAVLAKSMNILGAAIGAPQLVDNTGGTVATTGTLPAITSTLSAASGGTNAVDAVSGLATLGVLKTNMAILTGHMNRIATAVGYPDSVSFGSFTPGFPGTDTLALVSASGTGVPGSAANSTLQNTVVEAELVTIAANLATIAALWNGIVGGNPAALTGTPGGSASYTAVVVQTAPGAAVDGAATTSAPKAGIDTALGYVNTNMCELSERVNTLLKKNGLSPLLTDNTGLSASGALHAVTTSFSAVDGSSGSSAVDYTTLKARMVSINNDIASITAKVNLLAPIYGHPLLVDSSGGVASNTIATVGTATAAGVSGAASTVLNTVANTYFTAVAGNCTSLMNKLNGFVSTSNFADQPLHNIAWNV